MASYLVVVVGLKLMMQLNRSQLADCRFEKDLTSGKVGLCTRTKAEEESQQKIG